MVGRTLAETVQSSVVDREGSVDVVAVAVVVAVQVDRRSGMEKRYNDHTQQRNERLHVRDTVRTSVPYILC